ncbi:HTH domain-containing protein, Cro/C1-type [Desulfonema limicola]|uniref:HTH domain-containing protein, Cro/C1-type n=1 Tax=Desulfonema limicola TaxID=45656 RepID=A0A975GJR4_9BACT|nr:HTH domain-containing protein, Cro/C1-type [Desulfonema limicola]
MRFKLKEMILKRSYEENKVIPLRDIAKATGISSGTISRIANSFGDYNTTTDNLAKLCQYFDCTPNDLMTIVPDPPVKDTQGAESKKQDHQ